VQIILFWLFGGLCAFLVSVVSVFFVLVYESLVNRARFVLKRRLRGWRFPIDAFVVRNHRCSFEGKGFD